jgi:hypothetical protein
MEAETGARMIWLGAIACLLMGLFLICAICVAYQAMTDEDEEEFDDFYLPELRFTSQGRVLRVERFDEGEYE